MNKTILSVANALSWSWGLSMYQLVKRLPGYDFIHTVGQRRMFVDRQCDNCNHLVKLEIKPSAIADDLIDHFDLTLLQNLENLKLVRTNKKKVICRSGGMFVNDNSDKKRYNGEIAEVGAVIATNKELFDIADGCNENVFLIPNGVDLDHFKPAELIPDFERRFIVGFAGNIWGLGLTYKGYQYFAKAMCALVTEVGQMTLLHAHSQIPHEEMVEKFYSQIDCLVLCSKGEGCSNVVTESLACGVPVLLTKVGYHGEMLEHEKNCLFIERDAQSIEAAVRKLINNPGLRLDLVANGRRFAEEHHDIREIAKKYDEVFQCVLNNSKEN